MTANSSLERQVAAHAPISDCPLLEGNAVHLLSSGLAALSGMFQAMAAARCSIHMEFYIFEEVEIDKQPLSALLMRKAREGVQVAVSYDAFGSSATPDAWFDQLAAGGVQVLAFQPLNPFRRRFSLDANYRDHRKILVVDGAVAFLGGVNMSHTYLNPPSAGFQADTSKAFWRDAAVRIEGPIVAEVQALFFETWDKQEGPALPAVQDRDPPPPAGDSTIRVEGSAPRDHRPLYSRSLRAAVKAAHSHILLATGYFVPSRREYRLLSGAARRGVQVDLLLAGCSDVPATVHAGRALYGRLMRRGVRIHEVQDAVLHAKVATIDGSWVAIGSSNFDRRSVVYNNEADAIILGAATAEKVEAMLQEWMASAVTITMREWENRSWNELIKERLARVWKKYM